MKIPLRLWSCPTSRLCRFCNNGSDGIGIVGELTYDKMPSPHGDGGGNTPVGGASGAAGGCMLNPERRVGRRGKAGVLGPGENRNWAFSGLGGLV